MMSGSLYRVAKGDDVSNVLRCGGNGNSTWSYTLKGAIV